MRTKLKLNVISEYGDIERIQQVVRITFLHSLYSHTVIQIKL